MTFLRYFFYIVIGAFVSSILGGLFACVVTYISPAFVEGLFSPRAGIDLTRYAAAVGMIWGLFLGTGVMSFSLLLMTATAIAKIFKKKSEERHEA